MTTETDHDLRPRLLTLTPDFPPSVGGVQLLLERLLLQLPQWRHLVLARAHPGPSSAIPSARTRATTGPRSIVELNLMAAARGRAFRPDAILNGHVITTPGALAVAGGRRVPVVTYAYADELTHRPGLTRLAARRSTAVVAISRYTAELVRHHGPRGPVVLVPPGVDPQQVPRAESDRPTIVTVARLADRYKGHDVVLRALPAVIRAVPDVRWVVAGDGPLREGLERLADELGVADHVRFLGAVSDAERSELLAHAWVFVMPSRLPPRGAGGEGFGIAYLEAAAAGVPVVAGRVAGAVDAVDDGVTGLLVDPEDQDAVAAALVRIVGDDALRASLGRSGCDWARRFSWAAAASTVDGLLRRPRSTAADGPTRAGSAERNRG